MAEAPEPTHLTTPGYGFEEVERPGRALPWSEVERMLAEARTYWVVTTRADGRPHVAPVWGVWLDRSFLFETSSASVKARNLLAHPECVVHLDHTEAAVILEGRAGLTSDEELLRRFTEAYDPKYDWKLEPYLERPVSRTFVVAPRVVFSYREHLGATSTRWEFT